MTARLKERYEQEVKPALMTRVGYTNPTQVPKLEKITVNMGVGEAKMNSSLLDAAGEQLAVITGQKAAVRRARKSIANFKVREGMPVGVKVTLRGERMYEMLDRLQSIAIPRIRDFRGLNERSFDGRGNYSLGIKEQIVFPEVDYDSIDEVRGLDVTITTTAETDDEARELLGLLGMPFKREDERSRPSSEDAPGAAEASEAGEAPQPEPGQGEAAGEEIPEADASGAVDAAEADETPDTTETEQD